MSDFDGLKVEAKFRDAIGEERDFSTLNSIAEFFEKEQACWSEALKNPGNNEVSNGVLNAFRKSTNEISQFKSSYSQWPEDIRARELQNLPNKIAQHLNRAAFSNTPFAEALLKVVDLGQRQSQSFWSFVTRPNNGQLPDTSFPSLQGAILGYEYLFQDESLISKRRKAEERTIRDLRKQLSDKVDETIAASETRLHHITENVTLFKDDLSQWKQATADALAKEIEENRLEKDSFFNKANSRINELESLYSEKLKLEKPAEYWKIRAEHFRKIGHRWGLVVTIVTIVSAILFSLLFSQWLKSGQALEKFSAQHWQGVILLVSVLSLVAFLIRIFGRLTFSSFHLQRDAEEREQLCYLYLALINEKEIDTESRKIILQSLFSRSDTGLLTGDHGPTMPGISDMVSKKISS